jgi:Fic family protein
MAIPERSGCFAVVPEPVPTSVSVPGCATLFVLARRELETLKVTIAANPERADLIFHMLNRREAVDSSQIEGTHTGFDDLLIHEIEAGLSPVGDRDAEETLSYVHAFMHGIRAVQTTGHAALDNALIRQIHAMLMQTQPHAMPGAFRERQNYIGTRLEMAHYIPPPAALVPQLMDNLVSLLQYEPEGVMEVSVLMRAPIAHVQFEAIHPFLDGNGRTGRLLLPLILAAAGEPPLHLATFLKVRQQDYYAALLSVQMKLDWTPWIRLFLECVIASARHTVQLFAMLAHIQQQWHEQLTTQKRRKHATIWKVADLLIGQPVITATEAAKRLGVTFPAANDAINDLAALDILRPNNTGKRNRVFQSHEVLNALYTGLDTVLDEAAAASNLSGF